MHRLAVQVQSQQPFLERSQALQSIPLECAVLLIEAHELALQHPPGDGRLPVGGQRDTGQQERHDQDRQVHRARNPSVRLGAILRTAVAAR